jgi:hypothetical protein
MEVMNEWREGERPNRSDVAQVSCSWLAECVVCTACMGLSIQMTMVFKNLELRHFF